MTAPVGLLVSQLAAAYELAFLEGLAAHGWGGISSADHAVLRSVARGGVTATAIAQALGVSKQAIGKTVGSLERRGYVVRTRSHADGRAQVVSMTDHGRQLVGRAVVVARALDARTREVLGDDDLERLRALLTRLHDARDHLGDPAGS